MQAHSSWTEEGIYNKGGTMWAEVGSSELSKCADWSKIIGLVQSNNKEPEKTAAIKLSKIIFNIDIFFILSTISSLRLID